jgi:hypothetical protein
MRGAGLKVVVLLCLLGLGFLCRTAIAQGAIKPYSWHMTTVSIVLTAEHEMAIADRLDLQGMCERLPGDDRRPGRQIHYGVVRE